MGQVVLNQMFEAQVAGHLRWGLGGYGAGAWDATLCLPAVGWASRSGGLVEHAACQAAQGKGRGPSLGADQLGAGSRTQGLELG